MQIEYVKLFFNVPHSGHDKRNGWVDHAHKFSYMQTQVAKIETHLIGTSKFSRLKHNSLT
jgi:hypothetical protein